MDDINLTYEEMEAELETENAISMVLSLLLGAGIMAIIALLMW